jgi:hypothetical protein
LTFSVVNPNGTTGCNRQTNPAAPGTPAFTSLDYIPHHAWFQYFASTRNTSHARPSSVAAIGQSFIPTGPQNGKPEPANHQYDINDFFAGLNGNNLPAVSFLKAAAFQDGHAGYSDPLDEQTFLSIRSTPCKTASSGKIPRCSSSTTIDHQMPPVVNPSFNPTVDTLNGTGVCNNGVQHGTPTPATPLNGAFGQPAWGRCGYGTRIPLMVISPWAKKNFVDHTLTDQTSVLRFIEDNWLNGARIQPGASFDSIAGAIENMFDFTTNRKDKGILILNPATGAPSSEVKTAGAGLPMAALGQ